MKTLKINLTALLLLILLYACETTSTEPVIENNNSAIGINDTTYMQHFAHYSAVITDAVHHGDTPRGYRVDWYFEGSFTGSRISGTMEGIDYYLIRPDGVSEINAFCTITTNDGAAISVHIMGLCFADGTIKDSYVKLETGFEEYMWVNNTVFTGFGTAPSDNTLEIDYYNY